MIANLMDMLFGCMHRNYSFPMTSKGAHRRSEAAQATGTYVVCLDCGREFAYDWHQMKVVTPDTAAAAAMAASADAFKTAV